jgi:hypothetical protein
MSALPFVFLNGSPQSKRRNKKIVRLQVAKYRKAKSHRHARQGQQATRIAPNTQRTADSSPDLTTLPSTKSLPTEVSHAISSGSGYTTTRLDDQKVQLEECPIEIQIEPAAVVGLLTSDGHRGKNLRKG